MGKIIVMAIVSIAVLIGIAVLAMPLLLRGSIFEKASRPRRGTEEAQLIRELSMNGVALRVEIADTPEKRKRGLSGREGLGESEGMLFLFRRPQRPSFWMKDMRFPIDILWIDEKSRVSEVTERLAPESFPQTFRSEEPVRAVLEVNAGWAERHKIKAGDHVEGIQREMTNDQ